MPPITSADPHADTLSALSAEMQSVDRLIGQRLQSEVALIN